MPAVAEQVRTAVLGDAVAPAPGRRLCAFRRATRGSRPLPRHVEVIMVTRRQVVLDAEVDGSRPPPKPKLPVALKFGALELVLLDLEPRQESPSPSRLLQ